MISPENERLALHTPLGRTVTVTGVALGAIVTIVEDARARAFDEVLEFLDRDYARFKECGDAVTADVLDIVRTKVRAKRDAK